MKNYTQCTIPEMIKFKSLFLFLLFSGFINLNINAVYDPKYPFHPSFSLPFVSSDLPIVIINLDERMAEKWENRQVYADMKIIWNKDGEINHITDTEHLDYDGKIRIRYRGNSSFTFSDKKPFSVKLSDENGENIKMPVLGMGKDHDWAFLAPFSDKSMMRDVLLFELMKGTFDYTPSGRYCEVVLNGVYQGVYIICERARQGSKRIDIKKPVADEGVGVTGGYHLEIDRNDDPGFWSDVRVKNLREQQLNTRVYYQFKYPDVEELTDPQKEYIERRVKEMERAISGDEFEDRENGYRAYLDTLSIMDFYIAQELSKNVDAYRLSTPLYKYSDDIDPRFKFTIWDFNIAFGNANYMHGWSTDGWAYNHNRFSDPNLVPWFFKRLLQDEIFHDNLKKRWKEYRTSRFSDKMIIATIDSLSSLLQQSQERNFQVWGRFNGEVWPNYYIADSWEDEVEFLKEWILARVKWIDSQWTNEYPNLVPNGDFEAAFTRRHNNKDVWLSEWNTAGDVVLSNTNVHAGDHSLSIRNNSNATQIITELTPGMYDLRLWAKTQLDPKAYLYLKYHNNRNGSDELRRDIQKEMPYHLIEIKDIEVSNNFAEIGFVTQNSTGDVRLWVDEIEFIKQSAPPVTQIQDTYENDKWIELFVDRNDLSLTLNIDVAPEFMDKEELNIYDIVGGKVYSTYINSNQLTITNVFVRNHIYLVQVGNTVKKVVF